MSSEPHSAAAALTLEGVGKRFNAFVALADIGLAVRTGELVCFLGPSGCGKTTLLRIVAGLEAHDEGRILQNGRDISALPPSRRDYGIVFQSYALFPNLTAADNIAYGLVNRRQTKQAIAARVAELLALVRLPDAGGKFPSQLSGGQQQRIALARALATSPGLLLLDEPLSALDALERVRLRAEIRSLQQRLAVTTIMVTHDQEEAMSIADRIVVMNRGRIEQIGAPQEVYAAPATAFVADFVGKVNVLDACCVGPDEFASGGLRMRCVNAASRFRNGEPVRVYLRPEDISALNGVEEDADASGCVQNIEFLGAHCVVSVSVAGSHNQMLALSMPATALGQAKIARGAQVRLRLHAERAHVFPAV